MKKYWGFGLNIEAELEFPELLPAEFEKADLRISLGHVPDVLQHPVINKRPFSTSTEQEYLLNVKNVSKYYAGFGNTIIIEPATGIDEQSIRLFLLSTVMAAIVYQRGHIPFHASAIIKEGSLVLFMGASGAGKSTLLANLRKRGHEVFSDDVCVLQLRKDMVFGTASYPMMKLWTDSITHLSDPMFTLDFKIRPQLPKYGQFFYNSFTTAPLPVAKIFVLTVVHDAEQITTSPIVASQTFKALEKQAYRYKLMVSPGIKRQFFELASYITNTIPVLKIARPEDKIFVDILADKIESML